MSLAAACRTLCSGASDRREADEDGVAVEDEARQHKGRDQSSRNFAVADGAGGKKHA